MASIPVYEKEIFDGLAEKIGQSQAISYASELKVWDVKLFSEQEKVIAELKKFNPSKAISSIEDFDLHFLETILATSGWNKNDDVFDQLEMWTARTTPVHKPINYEHDCANIIGHMINCWGLDEDGKLVDDAVTYENLPKKLHLATGGVLYKYWDKDNLQERMDSILVEMAKGEWFVSMECLFNGFDYSIRYPDGATRIVARNEQTSFLTKHLRAYGGNGKYGDAKVGRLLRNIVFSGKGLVRRPANPESIIFNDTETFISTKSIITDFSQTISEQQVYVDVAKQNSDKKSLERNLSMATDNAFEIENQKLKAEVEQLKSSLRENDVKEIKARAEKAEQDKEVASKLLKDAEVAIAKVKAGAEAVSKELETVKAKLVETEKSVSDQAGEIKSLYAEKTKSSRLVIAKEKLALEEKDAEEFVTASQGLNDETFNKQVELMVKTVAGMAKKAPKSTPAPLPPQSTPAPAPMAGSKASEDADDKGEKTVEGADLSKVEEETEKSLAGVVVSGVNEVQKAIAEYFGVEEETEE